jgi:hypothetical protein
MDGKGSEDSKDPIGVSYSVEMQAAYTVYMIEVIATTDIKRGRLRNTSVLPQ